MIMFSREFLDKQNVAWLMTANQQFGLPRYSGKGRKSKEELVEQILSFESQREAEEYAEKYRSCVDMAKVNREDKNEYIETVPFGVLVAFADGENVNSAKLTDRDNERKVVQVSTLDNRLIWIDFNDILWVKTGARWPRGIYNLLKQRRK